MKAERVEKAQAYQVLDVRGGAAPLVLSCEHASVRLPEGWAWPEQDEWLVGTHWSYDIGAAELTFDCASALGAPAVLARFSRLLCDPNRDLDSPTLFRAHAEGRDVELNLEMTIDERARRLRACYDPYHDRLDGAVVARPAATVLSVHTFTPIYDGQARDLEVGVLYDHDEGLAAAVAASLAEAGVRVALNEPYSGLHGMMYAAQHHAERHDRRAVELEVRQDLAGSPAWRARFARILKRGLEQLLPAR